MIDQFEELAVPHIGALYRQAYYLAGDQADAEDLVQDVFVKAKKSFHTLQNHAKCKAWLSSILYRRFIDTYRRRRYHEEFIDAPAPEENTDTEWPDQFSREGLLAALDSIDPRYRVVLVAHFFSEQSYQEIAETLNIPLGTVMSRIHRAKAAMRKVMEAAAEAPSLKVIAGGRHGVL